MRTVLRVAALIVGIIGTFDGLVVNTVVSTYHDAARLLNANVDQSHGFIGLLLCVIGLAGAVAALRWSVVATVLLAVAGIGFFFIVHWWALLAGPQWIVAAMLTAVEAVDTMRKGGDSRAAVPAA